MLFGRKGPAGPEPRTRKETTHSADKIAWEKQPHKPPRGIFYEFFCKNIPPGGLFSSIRQTIIGDSRRGDARNPGSDDKAELPSPLRRCQTRCHTRSPRSGW